MTLSKTARSFLIAGLAAPALGGLWSGVFFSVLMAVSGGAYQWPPTFLEIMALTALYSAAIALVLTWTVGLAWHIVASRMNWRGLTAYLSFGLATGALLGLGMLIPFAAAPIATAAFAVIWLGSTGVAVAVTGWFIRRPDRDPANPPTSPS